MSIKSHSHQFQLEYATLYESFRKGYINDIPFTFKIRTLARAIALVTGYNHNLIEELPYQRYDASLWNVTQNYILQDAGVFPNL